MPVCDSVFFACRPGELPERFPGWVLPLRRAVKRPFKNPFTNRVTMSSTKDPGPDAGYDAERWQKFLHGVFSKRPRRRLTADEDEYRGLPWPHFTIYNIWPARLAPLARALRSGQEQFEEALRAEPPLYPPPSEDGETLDHLWEFPGTFTAKLASADKKRLDQVAARRSVEGNIAPEASLRLVHGLAEIARSAGPRERMYLYNLDTG